MGSCRRILLPPPHAINYYQLFLAKKEPNSTHPPADSAATEWLLMHPAGGSCRGLIWVSLHGKVWVYSDLHSVNNWGGLCVPAPWDWVQEEGWGLLATEPTPSPDLICRPLPPSLPHSTLPTPHCLALPSSILFHHPTTLSCMSVNASGTVQTTHSPDRIGLKILYVLGRNNHVSWTPIS